jgi:hypothetical protein
MCTNRLRQNKIQRKTPHLFDTKQFSVQQETSQNGPVNLDIQNKAYNGNENKSYFMKTFDSGKRDFQK